MRCESLYVCGKRGGFIVNGELIRLIPGAAIVGAALVS
jgi:hypothetical protein